MTMLAERARAWRSAGEFIQEFVAAAALSEECTHQALLILRHYPSATEIDLQLATGKHDVVYGRLPSIAVPPEAFSPRSS